MRAGLLLLAALLAAAVLGSPAASAKKPKSCEPPYCPSYTLKVKKEGDGSGTVVSSPVGIDCGADCEAGYEQGTTVTLTATPAPGSTFHGWSGGGCKGTGTCVVTITHNTTVSATFHENSSHGGHHWRLALHGRRCAR
jgi:hypothetical protein